MVALGCGKPREYTWKPAAWHLPLYRRRLDWPARPTESTPRHALETMVDARRTGRHGDGLQQRQPELRRQPAAPPAQRVPEQLPGVRAQGRAGVAALALRRLAPQPAATHATAGTQRGARCGLCAGQCAR